METARGKSYLALRKTREVAKEAKDNWKHFVQVRKSILEALKEGDLTTKQLTEKLQMPEHEVVYYVMSLVKFGYVQTGAIDDNEEYFYYKLKT